MKNIAYIFVSLLLATACNSYNHEDYIAGFKHNVDAAIENDEISSFDSVIIAKYGYQTYDSLRKERIATDRFYIDNYSWYQLGKNLILTPCQAKHEANKYGFKRPYYYLEFLKCDSVQNPEKKKIIEAVRQRLFEKHGSDSVVIYGSSVKQLFAAVQRYERSKYYHFIKVDFEKVKNASPKQQKAAAQMMQTALNRLKEKVEVKNRRYYLTISSGEEIGISESLFVIGKNIYRKMNEHLDESQATNTKFVKSTTLFSKENAYKIPDWESAWKMYEYYGKE